MSISNTAEYYTWNGQDRDRPANRLYAQLLRRERREGPFLDWGCGTGWLVSRLSQAGISAGYDPSIEATAIAQSRCLQSQIVSDAAQLPDGVFQSVSAIHVVEHLTESEFTETVKTWKSKSTTSSVFLIATPDADGEAARIMGSSWRAFADPTHINLRGHSHWQNLLFESGFLPIAEGSDGLWDSNYPISRLKAATNRAACAVSVLKGKLLIPVGMGESYIGVWKRTDHF